MFGDDGGGMDADVTGSRHSIRTGGTTKAILVLLGFLAVFFLLLVLYG